MSAADYTGFRRLFFERTKQQNRHCVTNVPHREKTGESLNTEQTE
jgi:hypothetical protein